MIFLVTIATDEKFEKVKHSPHSINYIKHSVKTTSDLDINWRSYIPQRFFGHCGRGATGQLGAKFQQKKYVSMTSKMLYLHVINSKPVIFEAF